MIKEKIIIIGGGIAGLYSGYLLQNNGYEVTIIEARSRVGGRIYTEDGVDLGGQWISSLHKRAMRLCEQFGLDLYRQFDEGIHISYFNKKREEYTDTFAGAGFDKDSIQLTSMLGQHITEFERLSNTINLESKHQVLDEVSFSQWVENNITDVRLRNLINLAFYANTCADPKYVSFLFWIYFLKVCGGYKKITSIKNGAQEFRIKGGAQKLCQKLAEGLNIIYDSEVKDVISQNKLYTIKTENNIYFADKVVSALPLQLVPKINWSPALEDTRLSLYKSMQMGCINKLVVQYNIAFWRENGYSGAILSDVGPVGLCYDACSDNCFALVIFIFGRQEYSDNEILDHLASLLDNDLAKIPTKIYRKNWSKDNLSGGCYFAVPPVNSFTYYHHYLIKPHNNIYFIGTETAQHWMGYIEGALESSERLVMQLI